MKTKILKKNELCTWGGKFCSEKVPVLSIHVCDQMVLICKICLAEFERKLKESTASVERKRDKFE